MEWSIPRSILCIEGSAIVDQLLQMLHVTVATDLTHEKHNMFLTNSTHMGEMFVRILATQLLLHVTVGEEHKQ
jgi:hypothetical protein